MYHSDEGDSSIPNIETNLESESTNEILNSNDSVIPDTDEITPSRAPTTEYITFNLSEYNYVPLALPDVYALLAEFADPETHEFPAEFTELISDKGESLYSSLTTDEKGILRKVLCLREDTMIPLEESGLNIVDSLVPGVIAQKIRITAPQVMELITVSGGIEEAYHQADELNKYLYRYSVFNEDENLAALTKFLIAGFSADEAAESLVAALALSEPPLDTDDTTPVDINAAAKLFIEKIIDSPLVRGSDSGSQPANSENTRLQSVIDILIENSGLSLEEANEIIEKYKLNHNILYNGASPRSQTLSQKYPSAPFNIEKNINENINLNTGAIIYEDTLAVIPGIHTVGIGLELTMQYDLDQAYCAELSGTYTSSGGYQNVKNAKPTTINPMSYMGEGWALKFDRIVFADSDKYLRFSDGSMFKIVGSTLKNYELSGVSFQTNNGPYPDAMYRLKLSDGRKEYFDGSGNLVAIEDRYGYSIMFQRYSGLSGTYPNRMEILVSWSERGVIINYDNSSAVFEFDHIAGVTAGGTITYDFDTANYGSGTNRRLISKVDQEGLVTTYNHRFYGNNLFYSFWPLSLAQAQHYKGLPLESVSYPNGMYTSYTYDETLVRLGYDWRDAYRVSVRKDVIGNTAYNQQEFDYGDANYAGWDSNLGDEFDPDDMDENYTYDLIVTNSSGLEIGYEFNYKHLRNWDMDMVQGAMHRLRTYLYNSRNLPTKITTRSHGLTTVMSAIETYEYDNYGNVTAYWNPLAVGDKNITDYKTTYTYDNTYQLPLTKTYKKDSATTITETNTLTTDSKSIAVSVVKENNVIKAKTSTTYYLLSLMPIEKREYINANEYISTIYSYYTDTDVVKAGWLGQISVEGVTTEFDYDSMGRIISVTEPNEAQTFTAYDLKGRVTQIINPDDTTKTNVYNTAANTITSTNENGVATVYTYNALGKLLTARQQGKTFDSVKFTYDSSLRVAREYDAKGAYTSYEYDAFDRVISKTAPSSLYQETYAYDDAYTTSLARVLKTIVSSAANAPAIKSAQYINKAGQTTQTSFWENDSERINEIYYDFAGNVIKELSANDNAAGRSFTVKYEYDFGGRITKTINALNDQALMAYDWLGRKTSATDFKGKASLYFYDDHGRITKEELPFTGTYKSIKEYTYDEVGNLTEQTQTNNIPGNPTSVSKTTYVYNIMNRLTRANAYEGLAIDSYVTYTYDALGNRLTQSTANGTKTTSYDYDTFNRLVELTDPLTNSESYIYDNNGNLAQKTDRNGNTITTVYDALNRPSSVTALKADGTTIATEFMTYTYYPTGAKQQETNESASTTFVYDTVGRLIKETETTVTTLIDGFALPIISVEKTYTYDTASNRKSMAIKRGTTTQLTEIYNYDALNRLYTVFVNGTVQATYTYDANGNRTNLLYPSGILTTDYEYNDANLVTSLQNTQDPAVLSSFTYEYRLDGNQINKTEDSGIQTDYEYDDLGRLIKETLVNESASSSFSSSLTPDSDTSPQLGQDNTTSTSPSPTSGTPQQIEKIYTYDNAGNRASMTVVITSGGATSSATTAGATTAYTYDANNRLIGENTGNIATTYAYDANGNQTGRTTGSYVESYTYDVFNRLTKTEIENTTIKYRYKPNGLRVAKQTQSANETQTVIHVWDGSNIALELDGSGAVANKYIRGINLIKNFSTGYIYLFNAHGDVVQLTDYTGVLVKDYRYDAFGVEADIDPSDTNPWRYCGEYFDLLNVGESGDSAGSTTLTTLPEVTYVSDMDYTEDYLYWPLRADRSIDNNTLTINGVEYEKGLGSHAYSNISVELNGNYDVFSSVIGIDDEVADRSQPGNSTFVVLLDGEEVYNSGVMTPGMAEEVYVDVKGKRTMQLVTQLNGDYMNDHTDWADAKLLTWHTTDYISDMDYTEDYLYWPLRADRSIDNHPITLDGVEYAKGLGSHAYSKISVELNGEYNLFGSVIGLDDEVMGMSVVGNSTFKVLLDGEEVYNSGEMTPGMTDTILLDVSDMDLLELITENNGDYMYDHTDWADARLIKYATEKPRGAVGTYYLRARYYQPTTGRFMSEDSIRDGLNYYTYAMNNPLFFKDPFGFAAVQLRQWFNEKLSYIQSVYKNTSGSLNWTDYTKTATIHMSANGYSGHAAFTVGKDGSYIDSNSRMWVDESLLWQVFGNVIDPPAQVKSAKEVVVEQLETIPLTNYLEAAFGKDLYGNSLNTDQRLDKVAVGLEIGLDAMTNAYVMAGLKYDIKMVDQASKALNMSKRQTAAFKAEIEDIKHGEGRSNNYTFEWKRLLEIGREVMQWTK